MKKTITEELERIHKLTYGDKVVNESAFMEKILKTLGLDKESDIKIDEPNKADNLTGDADEFFKVLKKSISDGGLKQQTSGDFEYQKEVESLQIGLKLLGYDLPQHGVDGLFGPETASAVKKFMDDHMEGDEIKVDNSNITENILYELEMVKLKDTSYDSVTYDTDGTQNDSVNKGLLDDLEKAGKMTGIDITITTAKTGHGRMTKTGNLSRHTTQTAVDIGLLNGIGSGRATNSKNGKAKFRELGNKLKDALVSLGYVWNTERGNQKAVLWQTNLGGNHYNHLHVSNNGNASKGELSKYSQDSDKTKSDVEIGLVATSSMISKLIELLSQKNIDDDDLKPFVDKFDEKKIMDYLGNTDDDFYKGILNCIGAPVTNENMMFMYAWRQSEGGKYRNNPFNTKKKYHGATGDGIKHYKTPQDGINATCETLKLKYYTCIVDGLKNNIGAMNISQKCNSALSTWGTHATNPLITQVLKGYEKGGKIDPDDIYT
jgi:hypothetical protein